jgi:ankyrin repeat protein
MPWRISKEEELISAAKEGDMSKIAQLLNKGANINYRKKDEQVTALDLAILDNNIELTNFLLEHGADVNNTTKNGYTALLVASTPYSGNFDVVDTLIEHGADVNAKSFVEQWSPLLLASTHAFPDESVIRRLVEAGAQINDSNVYGVTPLMSIARFGSDALVEYLLKKGANANLKSADGSFIINMAASSAGGRFLEQLKTDLSTAAKARRLEATYGKGMDSMADDFSEKNRSVRPKVVGLLLDYGADIESRDPDGLTPLINAIVAGNTEVVETLIQRGANINVWNAEGETALMTAVWWGQRGIVDLLLKVGANINCKKTTGENAFEWAIFRGYDDIARKLMEAGAKKEFSVGFLESTSMRNDITAILERLGLTL